MYNIYAMLGFLSSFCSGHAVQDHIHFVEVAKVRDADNEIDIFKTLERFWQIQITVKALDAGSSRIPAPESLWSDLFTSVFFLLKSRSYLKAG